MLVGGALLSLAGVVTGLVTPSVQTLDKRTASPSVTVKNSDKLRFDVNGNGPLDVGDTKLSFLDNQSIMYGNTFGCGFEWMNFAGAACNLGSYSSSDLTHWTKNPPLMSASTYATHCPSSGGGCGRPHVLYHEASKKYILWVNSDAVYITFISDSPTEGYEFSGVANVSTTVFSMAHGDFGVEMVNGRAVLLFTAFDFTVGGSIWPPFLQRLYIQYLSDDYLGTTGDAYRVTSAADDEVDQTTEFPDVFTRNGIFYVTATNTCGFCNGTLAIVYRSDSIKGPWTRQIISEDACGGQLGSVLPIKSEAGTTYLALADLWSGGNNEAQHGHLLQPLKFKKDGSVRDLDCSADATFTFGIPSGLKGVTTGAALTATDSSDPWADYEVVCDVGRNQVTKTWVNSKSSTLKEVGFNLGRTLQDVPLTATIFKYEKNTNFDTPGYKWTTLHTETITPANVTWSLDVHSLFPKNVTVAAGDRLGVSLLSYASVGYCRMEHGVAAFNPAKSTNGLFINAIGQVSGRGKDGKASPVFASSGREMKWFSVVA